VDIGGNTTGLAVIKSGRIRHIASFPYAGDRITADVVHGLSVTQGDAERLKERWGVAYTPLVDPDETIELPSTPGQGIRQAKRELLAHIIHQRLDEVMGLVQKEIVDAGFHDGLPAGVILTGGVAQMPGVVELAREVFAMPARMGTPSQRISGLVDSVSSTRYAVAAGLVLYAARESIHGEDRSNLRIDKFLGPVKRFFQDFF
jgi:cell division protein FtsA